MSMLSVKVWSFILEDDGIPALTGTDSEEPVPIWYWSN